MSLSRSLTLFRQVRSSLQPKNLVSQQVRHSGSYGYVYRTSGHMYNKKWATVAEGIMALAWWWFLWHAYHEYEWVTGEFDVPDPRKWTDEELGIPPDSEG